MSDQIDGIIDVLSELTEDNTVPKNVKVKIEKIKVSLSEKGTEMSLKINKALDLLDEVSDDNNLESYTRTQLWNIASMLESLN